MPRRKKTTNNNKYKGSSKSLPNINEPNKAADNAVHSNSKKHDQNTANKSEQPETVVGINPQDEANRISVKSLWANIVLCILTLLTFVATLYFSNRSLNTQIDSIKETQTQFKVLNRPLLQIENIVIDSIGIDKKLHVVFDIANLGNYPAKILESRGGLAIDTAAVANPLSKIDLGSSVHKRYVTNNKPYRVTSEHNFRLPVEAYVRLRAGIYKFFLFGEILYSNETTETRRKYTYYIMLNPIDATIEMINNENVDVER